MGQVWFRAGWRAIVLFLGLLVALTTPLDLLLIHTGRLDIGRGFPIHMVMWAPGLAALATCRICRIDLAFLGLSRFAWRAVLSGYLVVILYSVGAFASLWLTKLAPLDWPSFAMDAAKRYDGATAAPFLTIIFTLTFGVVQSGASALGEEIGWRGFLTPALRDQIGVGPALLTSGLIWAAWHFPLTIYGDYAGTAPLTFQLLCFTVMIVATGAIYGLIRLRSGSVWPAVVMHAAHNAVIQWLLDPMTNETGGSAWYAGEFGAALAVVTLGFAAVILIQYRGHRFAD